MLKDTTKIEIIGFRQDRNKEDGTGTVTVIVKEGNDNIKGEVLNTTVADFIERASNKIGSRCVNNMIGQDRQALNRAKRQEQSDAYRAMHSFNGKKRSRELN